MKKKNKSRTQWEYIDRDMTTKLHIEVLYKLWISTNRISYFLKVPSGNSLKPLALAWHKDRRGGYWKGKLLSKIPPPPPQENIPWYLSMMRETLWFRHIFRPARKRRREGGQHRCFCAKRWPRFDRMPRDVGNAEDKLYPCCGVQGNVPPEHSYMIWLQAGSCLLHVPALVLEMLKSPIPLYNTYTIRKI